MSSQNYKTWINLKSSLADHNLKIFRSLIGPKVKLWAVVKSNAYGHGLLTFSKLVNELGVDGFCADSVIEGIKLRDSGIKKPILVLGPTLPSWFKEASGHSLTISISQCRIPNSCRVRHGNHAGVSNDFTYLGNDIMKCVSGLFFQCRVRFPSFQPIGRPDSRHERGLNCFHGAE